MLNWDQFNILATSFAQSPTFCGSLVVTNLVTNGWTSSDLAIATELSSPVMSVPMATNNRKQASKSGSLVIIIDTTERHCDFASTSLLVWSSTAKFSNKVAMAICKFLFFIAMLSEIMESTLSLPRVINWRPSWWMEALHKVLNTSILLAGGDVCVASRSRCWRNCSPSLLLQKCWFTTGWRMASRRMSIPGNTLSEIK